MAVWEQIGQQFVQEYYRIFDSDRTKIISLYHPDAMITFEEFRGQGHKQITETFTEKLRFQTIQHIVTKVDCQPTAESGVIILVTGRLKTDDDPPHAFSQIFYVRPADNSYFIYHDIFRLSIHDM